MPGPRLSGSGEQKACPVDLTEFGWRQCLHTPSDLGQSLPIIPRRIAGGMGVVPPDQQWVWVLGENNQFTDMALSHHATWTYNTKKRG